MQFQTQTYLMSRDDKFWNHGKTHFLLKLNIIKRREEFFNTVSDDCLLRIGRFLQTHALVRPC